MPNYPDIFFTPEYQELFEDTAFGGELCHFSCAGIDYRFYKRPIEGTPYFDIVSPYGYSGPVREANIGWWPVFLTVFCNYCMPNSIIAGFARLHPFIKNHKYLEPACLKYEHDIFYIDLTQNEGDIWKGFDKGCKSAIKKAQKKLLVSITDNVSPSFLKLYTETMKRDNASKGYYFNRDFYLKLDTLKPVCVEVNDLSSALMLVYGDYAHYFLSGSSMDSRGSGAGNLVLYELIKIAKAKGCKVFNLGGGVHGNDSLASFKRSFTKTSKPFYTYRKIHNQEVYNQLCKAKGIDPNSDGFFPAYRRV